MESPFSDEASCSDCKLELVQKRWTQLLLNWINMCVTPNGGVKELNWRSLVEIINRYKHDICANDLDRAMLCTDDLEPFLRYKYPILRLRYFTEDEDIPRKLYMMTSMLLFHCVVSSQMGVVVGDICQKLDKDEREMVLLFCEKLSKMETTLNNVDCAVRDACETVYEIGLNQSAKRDLLEGGKEINTASYVLTSDSTIAASTKSSKESKPKRQSSLKFKSSVTVLPSCVTDESYSKTSVPLVSSASSSESSKFDDDKGQIFTENDVDVLNSENIGDEKKHLDKCSEKKVVMFPDGKVPPCKPDCKCTNCTTSGPSCGIPGSSVKCNDGHKVEKASKCQRRWFIYMGVVILVMVITGAIGMALLLMNNTVTQQDKKPLDAIPFIDILSTHHPNWAWICKNDLCHKAHKPEKNASKYNSLSRCTLQCMGPQIWPQPIGLTHYSKHIVSLATNKLEYKFQSIPSDSVHQYLGEAFKLFLGDLARLERIGIYTKNKTQDFSIKKMIIQMDVESDPDPRLRLNTDESYYVKIETNDNQVRIYVHSASFCGVRHGLETLSQIILLDQSTGNLITLSNAFIKDAPSYKYRGLMIDTGRNYIPVPDLLKAVDAMATCKLNTFHWRISGVTSFPLLLPKLRDLFEYGAYDKSMVYRKEDVRTLVRRAGVRGIRVLIEVAVPGPVGRAWSWSDGVTCNAKNDKHTCNQLCLRLKMQDSVFDLLQDIYSEIIELTYVDDIFHLSDSVHSMANCKNLINDRDGFLEKALDRLRLANKGFLPKMPVVWYSGHLVSEAKTWERYGVQFNEWLSDSSERALRKFRAIHSSKWDLSCEIKKNRCTKYRTWQEMYSWNSWQTIDVFSVEGGEAILWTDLVDSGNLEYHLWPRAAAVAERLWSDIVANTTTNGQVYIRLDNHRWRMQLRGMKVQPIWPVWCSFNPAPCLVKVLH